MRVCGVWYGGASYSYAGSTVADNLERFDSLAHARAALEDRFSGRRLVRFDYVNRDPEVVDTPAVDETSEIHIFFCDPTDESHPCPDRVIRFGPRGGIVTERL